MPAFLHLLARAVHTFRIYPSDSPFRAEAIAACHEGHTALHGDDRLVCRVTPRELLVDGVAIGAGTVVEHELARRLHRVRVAELTIHCRATVRDLSRFCADLIECDLRQGGTSTLAERLTEHGIDTIMPGAMSRPEVLEVRGPERLGAFSAVQPRDGFDGSDGSDGSDEGLTGHLYPKGKGWIRVDPASPAVESVSLADLAATVDDPGDLSHMLLRLGNEGDTGDVSREAALRLKFDDVVLIYESMEPTVARELFGRLARAVLALGAENRTALLKRTVLPGLIEGRSAGQILNDFPDVDLADAIGLLLELDTADAGLVHAALTRLDLPAERQQAMGPLLQRRLKSRGETLSLGRLDGDDAIERFADKWIKLDAGGKNFAEFAAFDLSFDADTRAGTSGISEAIETADALDAERVCLLHLIRVEPNPQLAEQLLRRLAGVFAALERTGRWENYGAAVTQARHLGSSLQASRPDVADAIASTLAACCTRVQALRLVHLSDRGGESKTAADRMVEAFGATLAPAFVELIEEGLDRVQLHALSQLMRDHARVLAPGMASRLRQCSPQTVCLLLELLSAAGPGFERPIANQLSDGDDKVAPAALRALEQVATRQAVAAVASQIRTGTGRRCTAAEESLWRFPAPLIMSQLVELLGDAAFVSSRPRVAFRLLSTAMASHLDLPQESLTRLSRLMFRFWRPAMARVGFKARRMRAR